MSDSSRKWINFLGDGGDRQHAVQHCNRRDDGVHQCCKQGMGSYMSRDQDNEGLNRQEL